LEPTSPESAIRSDCRACRTLPSYCQVILGDKQLAIGIKHVREADDTCGVGLFRAVAHSL